MQRQETDRVGRGSAVWQNAAAPDAPTETCGATNDAQTRMWVALNAFAVISALQPETQGFISSGKRQGCDADMVCGEGVGFGTGRVVFMIALQMQPVIGLPARIRTRLDGKIAKQTPPLTGY